MAVLDLDAIKKVRMHTEPFRWGFLPEAFLHPTIAAELARSFPIDGYNHYTRHSTAKRYDTYGRFLIKMGHGKVHEPEQRADRGGRTMAGGRNASFAAVLFTAFAAIILFFAVPLNGQQRHAPLARLSAPAGMTAVGRLPESQRLSLAITLELRNQEELQSLLYDLYDPASPNYRNFLTVEQFTERFGPTLEDYERVSAFAATNGLAVTHTAPNRLVLDVEGTVADIERAFRVTVQVYQHPTEPRTFYAPDVEPSVDGGLPVQGISGLNTFSHLAPQSMHGAPSSFDRRANATDSGPAGSGPGGAFLGSDFRAAYASGVTLDGTGQALGVFEMGGYNISDVQSYFGTINQPLNVPIVNVLLDGLSGACGTGCDDGEQALDIEMAISMAPNLSALIVYEGSSPVDILNQMATDDIAKQLSCSYVFGSGSGDLRTDIQGVRSSGAESFCLFGRFRRIFSPPTAPAAACTPRFPPVILTSQASAGRV